MAVPYDGVFDIVLVKKMPVWRYPGFALRMLTGTLKANKYLEYLKTDSQLQIISAFKKMHIDGEPLLFKDSMNAKLDKLKLSVIKTRTNKY